MQPLGTDAPRRPATGAKGRKLLFIHHPKTGGTSINEALRQLKPAWRRHPAVFDNLPDFGREELRAADYYSGHYTRHSIDAVPGRPFRMTVLRDPVDRALSLVRFCRAHRTPLPVPALRAAQEMDVNEMFCSSIPRLEDYYGNWYVRAFVPSARLLPGGRFACDERDALGEATQFAAKLDLVGTNERLQETFEIVCAELDLGAPVPLPKRRGAEEMKPSDDYRDAPLEPLTAATRGRLAELTALDRQFYDHFRSAFEHRLGRRSGLSASSIPCGVPAARDLRA